MLRVYDREGRHIFTAMLEDLDRMRRERLIEWDERRRRWTLTAHIGQVEAEAMKLAYGRREG